ncbi:MAG: hypothetical protein LH610_01105, partial [Sphingomonas bacterium]|nr:hypothetical protein [Sphingomonas bacterium]
YAEALPILRRSASISLAQRTETHDDMAFIFANLALATSGIGDDDDAESLFRRGLAAAEQHKHRLLAPILIDLAALHCRRGRYDDVMEMIDRAQPLMAVEYPDDPWRSAWAQNTRGYCLLRQGKLAQGRTLIQASAPALLARWSSTSLYGFETERRLRAATVRVPSKRAVM